MPGITFQTIYHTKWGSHLAVVGNIPSLGNGDVSRAFRLSYIVDGLWSGTLFLDNPGDRVTYRYIVVNDKGEVLDEEWGDERLLPVIGKGGQVLLKEGWRSRRHPENAFFNSAFLEVLFKPVNFPDQKEITARGRMRFEISVPRSFRHLQVCVLGNIPELGNWHFQKPLLLDNNNFPIWCSTIAMPEKTEIQYKYGLYDPVTGRVAYLEEGENRRFSTHETQHLELAVVRDVYFRHRESPWKGSGVAIPVFSLRSRKSFGVGAFSDLRLLIDWACKVGMNLVQILPINDTWATGTWLDSYPYSSISVFALHSLYLDLEAIEGFKDAVDQTDFRKKQNQLNELPLIDYEEVMRWKVKYAKDIFHLRKKSFIRTKAFKEYLENHQQWLKPYALFCVLRDKYGTPDFSMWKKEAVFSEKLMEDLTSSSSPYYPEILFYYYLQFQLDRQLIEVSVYARSKGIVLKGDIAIGIYRDSADAWASPHLFDMESQAGAPPDPFSDLGQNWGFPTYRWEEMARDNYAWWQSRLQHFSRYFDAFRIDHILGFFRIWQIPYEQIQGLLGYFNPALPVTLDELKTRGIAFDQERFCQPYITSDLVETLFAGDTDRIKTLFLDEGTDGRFLFKEDFNSQRKIARFLDKNPDYLEWEDRLMQLHAEVLFITDSNKPNAYHPRIDYQKTYSFKSLDPTVRQKLQVLYIDYFYSRQEDFWKKQGLTRLPVIKKATDMLICGEDLGMIPACVPEVMKDLDILSLEIQRMSKNPKTEFLREEDIPYLSICSTSTHDMSPIRAWWVESPEDYITRFYQQELNFKGAPPKECHSFIAEQIIAGHLRWPSMWAIFPIQDILALSDQLKRKNPLEERINIPAKSDHYWQYRLHLYLEDLLEADEFNHHLNLLLQLSGR
jgi:4-alpha-glucanotransferase